MNFRDIEMAALDGSVRDLQRNGINSLLLHIIIAVIISIFIFIIVNWNSTFVLLK